MGTVLASEIMADAAETLLDQNNTRWTDPVKFGYVNDGQRLAVLYKPDINVVIDSYQLVEGTKQTLPDGTNSFQNPSAATLQECVALLDIIRNMGTAGTTPGGAIDPVDLQYLNAFNTDWHAETAAAAVQSYAFDERYPKNFYVYPPQPAASQGYVEVSYSALVADLVQPSSFDFVDGDVDVTANSISETGHGLGTGSAVVLSTTGVLPAGLSAATTYYAIRVDEDNFKLATSAVNARAGTAIDITAAAGGGTHTLTSSFLYGVAINISDRWQTALYYYVLNRCYDKDAALSPYNEARAVKNWNLFVTELGRIDLIKKAVSPNRMQPNPSASLK